MDLNDEKSVRELNVIISDENGKLIAKCFFIVPLVIGLCLSFILSNPMAFDYFEGFSPTYRDILERFGFSGRISQNANMWLLYYSFILISISSIAVFFYNKPKVVIKVNYSFKIRFKMLKRNICCFIIVVLSLLGFYLALSEDITCGYRCFSSLFISDDNNYFLHTLMFSMLQIGVISFMAPFFTLPDFVNKAE
ncbi:MAG: hypothetical protein ACTH8P_13745 [Ewingella sp.]|uniref:hypothetical protein n=1 Tax=Ewingella TaxID=41201 RepID=UPI0033653C7E